MSEFNISVNAGSSVKLKTAGKYCDRDIVVTAEGSSTDALAVFLRGDSTTLESDVTKIRGYACYNNNLITDLVLPRAKDLELYSFYGCTALKNVQLPNAENLAKYAFYGCTALESLDLPEAEVLFDYCFRNCSNLKTIRLPKVYQLYGGAFNGCKALEYIDFSEATRVPTLQTSTVFNNVPTSCQFRVPASLLEQWKAKGYWANVADQIVAAE